ncbi:HAD family hydrolase [Brachybacterium hainanense]|uniref:HAD family hydrolase n=1 Tax=Brachybacterium hainanense TaxID=1541174 RepID=A0ABV6RBG1_9MICO
MLLVLDLDGTLVDRAAAFSCWAAAEVAAAGGSPRDRDRLLRADAHGLAPREQVLPVLREVLRSDAPDADLLALLLMGHVDRIALFPGVDEQLRRARALGARIIVLTNGPSAQQRAKIARTGLDVLVDAVVISEEAGCAKPDPAIFARALQGGRVGEESWMLGDSPHADIGGGRAAGLRTGWVSHGRSWERSDGAPPDLAAPGVTELLARLLAVRRG